MAKKKKEVHTVELRYQVIRCHTQLYSRDRSPQPNGAPRRKSLIPRVTVAFLIEMRNTCANLVALSWSAASFPFHLSWVYCIAVALIEALAQVHSPPSEGLKWVCIHQSPIFYVIFRYSFSYSSSSSHQFHVLTQPLSHWVWRRASWYRVRVSMHSSLQSKYPRLFIFHSSAMSINSSVISSRLAQLHRRGPIIPLVWWKGLWKNCTLQLYLRLPQFQCNRLHRCSIENLRRWPCHSVREYIIFTWLQG